MRISLVVALDEAGLIGAAGGLPWPWLPADMRHFRAITMGKPVLMGRRTWESLPRRPLPGRPNVVLSRRPGYAPEGARAAADLAGALALAAEAGEEAMVIGGGALFAESLARADRLYLTRVAGRFEGDTWFPPIAAAQWRELERVHRTADARNPCALTFLTLARLAGDCGAAEVPL